MALCSISGLSVKGVVTLSPSNEEDNFDLPFLSDEEKRALVNHTGIRYRRKVHQDERVSDYLEQGIEALVNLVQWNIADIDVLVCVSQPKETQIPSISNQLHGKLNLKNEAMCFDINSGCSGYPYGLHVVGAMLKTLNKPSAKALLCVGDFSSQLIEENDKSTVPIFSDAVSVSAIEVDESIKHISYFNLETIGKGQKAITMENNYMRLNGIDVFSYAVQFVPQHIKKLLEYSNNESTLPEVFILHQANKLINDSIVKRIGIDAELAPSTLYDFGNTASASIPLTLGKFCEKQQIQTAVLCGFGVGFSIGSALVHLPQNFAYLHINT